MIDVARQRGQVTDLARAVARTGTVGGAAIPGHADEGDLHLLGHRIAQGQMRQAHEGGDASKARQYGTGDGKEKF
jgi:hypothetical protein